jgi:hypothetical protein
MLDFSQQELLKKLKKQWWFHGCCLRKKPLWQFSTGLAPLLWSECLEAGGHGGREGLRNWWDLNWISWDLVGFNLMGI